jgi:hypothetical protein
MTMPKAPMDKHHKSILRQHNIWAAGQVLPMKAEAKARSTKRLSNLKLRLSIFRFYRRHIAASTLTDHGEPICRDLKTNSLPLTGELLLVVMPHQHWGIFL